MKAGILSKVHACIWCRTLHPRKTIIMTRASKGSIRPQGVCMSLLVTKHNPTVWVCICFMIINLTVCHSFHLCSSSGVLRGRTFREQSSREKEQKSSKIWTRQLPSEYVLLSLHERAYPSWETRTLDKHGAPDDTPTASFSACCTKAVKWTVYCCLTDSVRHRMVLTACFLQI